LSHNALKHIPIYIQQDATLHSLLYLQTALHVSGGTITHHQERKQLYLQHLVFSRTVIAVFRFRGRAGTGLSVLWVAYATHNTLKPVPVSNNGVTNTRCFRYSCLRS